jgi:hypothetical protein
LLLCDFGAAVGIRSHVRHSLKRPRAACILRARAQPSACFVNRASNARVFEARDPRAELINDSRARKLHR